MPHQHLLSVTALPAVYLSILAVCRSRLALTRAHFTCSALAALRRPVLEMAISDSHRSWLLCKIHTCQISSEEPA